MKRAKVIILLVILMAIIAGIIGVYIYNKPHRNVDKAKPDFTMTTEELYGAYEENDSLADLKYLDKIIEVSGTVHNIQSQNDTNFTVLLRVEDTPTGNVICGMDSRYNDRLTNLKSGKKISLKGICDGGEKTEELGLSFMDVNLSRCVVVK